MVDGIVFSTKVVLLTNLDGMHSRNNYHYHKRNACVRSSRAAVAWLGNFPITPILCYASFSNPCECPSMPCFQHQSVCQSVSLSVCLSVHPLFCSSFSNVQMLCFCIIKGPLSKACMMLRFASLCMPHAHAHAHARTQHPPCYPHPILSFPNLSSPSHHPHLQRLSKDHYNPPCCSVSPPFVLVA